ncbi:alpha/beta fold hydrolase [Paraurantiacibacter namhicola]|uniref:Palmitoyl-protein thioesterase ABHD10, mitochondrial n=1 Tax=Paraurantiacibacter namhicola TaxID=645517 RepID=A0A1C7D5Z0_9SPHN|nr:alpha/beta hydrolase [Paraurantiacibacter namhicola]ANU06874.1 Alpha/beta hydrolase family protein [Paraurantiacibacter namhicola]
MNDQVQFHAMPDGRKIAFRHAAGSGPAVVFLPGYMSDMDGSKATEIHGWAQAQGRECLLIDYSGCGRSDGDFADGTLSRWRDEVIALVEAHVSGPVILVGSSMGGWLMLLVAQALGDRLQAMLGIAAAPDFTEWGYDAAQKDALAQGETIFEDNPYGPEPTPTHAAFWQDGQAQRQLAAPIALTCPVRLLHGQRDTDVPHGISLALADKLSSEDVEVTLVKDGDHRLSRQQDIALLLSTLERLA